MLRRAPTRITLTTEDIAVYEDARQAEREEEEEQKAKAEAARYRKARERSAFGIGKGDNYRELQALAAQRRVDDARYAQRESERNGGRELREGRGQSRESNAENELSEDEDRLLEREREQREERVVERERGERATERIRSRALLRDREAREQRSREERLGLGGGSGSGR
ncbi:hypothetical protein MFRU_002g01030 [Monilinia fructicola]|uniref:Uncharacterized protein n=1 Tax=Monilinia fructicola TaxID=38448 RepID=A0A5M9K4P9_MONFR|nr:hypothetical protein EYC84_004575 [Monilinia fructicola]KAG4034750.1 hypothetical protein MFRU_002g01030 [Monilinia fructicola]